MMGGRSLDGRERASACVEVQVDILSDSLQVYKIFGAIGRNRNEEAMHSSQLLSLQVDAPR